jgi:hypothetical protein
MNLLNFETLIASKAARMVLAAPGKELVDFGARRAHGAEAALLAARASYIAAFSGTATVLAERQFGIPIFGTMAHSFIEARDGKGTFSKDVLSLIDERHAGEALLEPVMRGGQPCARPSPDEIRAHARDELAHLPEALRRLEPFVYPVEVSIALQELAAECDRRMGL